VVQLAIINAQLASDSTTFACTWVVDAGSDAKTGIAHAPMAGGDFHRLQSVVLQIAIGAYRAVEAAIFVLTSTGCTAVARWAAGVEAIGRYTDEWEGAAAKSLVLEEYSFIFTIQKHSDIAKNSNNE
jgi:hypothetical protein